MTTGCCCGEQDVDAAALDVGENRLASWDVPSDSSWFFDMLGIGTPRIDRPVIEAFRAFWSDESPETADDDVTLAAKLQKADVTSLRPADQLAEPGMSMAEKGATVITELETAKVGVIGRDGQTPPESLPWIDVSPDNNVVREDSDQVRVVPALSEPVQSPSVVVFSTVDGAACRDEDDLDKRLGHGDEVGHACRQTTSEAADRRLARHDRLSLRADGGRRAAPRSEGWSQAGGQRGVCTWQSMARDSARGHLAEGLRGRRT